MVHEIPYYICDICGRKEVSKGIEAPGQIEYASFSTPSGWAKSNYSDNVHFCSYCIEKMYYGGMKVREIIERMNTRIGDTALNDAALSGAEEGKNETVS